MLREPKLFLMDEPLSSLDAQLRVHTRAEIVRLHERLQTTTVYVTHDQIEALSMGDRIGVLRDGRLEQVGPPREVYERPASLFVARFIGTPAMNTLPVKSSGAGLVFWNGHAVPVPARFHSALTPAGRDLVLGVRPEHVYLQGSRWAVGQPAAQPLLGTIDIIEMAGDQLFLELEVEGALLVTRAEPDFRVQRGQQVAFWFATEALHLFDPATELALHTERGA
jgi:multiple sugar transport system ATP-binding protein